MPRYMGAHRFQEVLHRDQQIERLIKRRSDVSKAFNQDFLAGDALFLLRHMAGRHLQFRLTRHHGGSPARSPP
jgi:hypothetical protein